jgi:hypothetical protein
VDFLAALLNSLTRLQLEVLRKYGSRDSRFAFRLHLFQLYRRATCDSERQFPLTQSERTRNIIQSI